MAKQTEAPTAADPRETDPTLRKQRVLDRETGQTTEFYVRTIKSKTKPKR